MVPLVFLFSNVAIEKDLLICTDYQDLFRMLGQVKGTLADRKAFVAELKGQAQRFKKQSLIDELDKYEKEMS